MKTAVADAKKRGMDASKLAGEKTASWVVFDVRNADPTNMSVRTPTDASVSAMTPSTARVVLCIQVFTDNLSRY